MGLEEVSTRTLPSSPNQSGNFWTNYYKKRPMHKYGLLLILVISVAVLASIITQLNIVPFDNDGEMTLDVNSLIHSMISNRNHTSRDEFLKLFGSQKDGDKSGNDDTNDDDANDDKGYVGDKDAIHNMIDKQEDQKVDALEQEITDKQVIVENENNNNNNNNNTNNNRDNESDARSSKPGAKKVSRINALKVNESITIDNPTPRQQLNVLILYPDDWRHDSIGSEKPYVLTPFLDKLAKEGIRFTHNAVTTSICWMSRATLWMGQYSSTHRSYRLRCPRFASPENWEHSWVKILQKTGYHIGHIGKWQYYTKNTAKFFDWNRLFEGHHWETVFGGQKVHAADLAKDHAIRFFDERPKDKPFVLSVAFYPPKAVGSDTDPPGVQWSPTAETRTKYDNVTIPRPEHKLSFKKLPKFLQDRGPATGRFKERYYDDIHFQASMKNYYALVTGVDKACEQIVDKLKQEGLYNNTMIIFTTDNGLFHGAHGLAGKWYPYQESVRVPLIIYDPRMPHDKIGTVDDSFTLNVDLAHTILGAAGVQPDDLMEGRDISDLYLPNVKNEYHETYSVEKEPWRQEFFYEFPSPDLPFIPSSTALVRKDWKYIYWVEHKREQIFNLKDDPLELNDLNTEDISENVKPVLEEMRKRHGDYVRGIFDDSYINDLESCKQFQIQHWH